MKKFLSIFFLLIIFFSIGSISLAQDDTDASGATGDNFGLDKTAGKVEAYKDQTTNTYDGLFVAETVGDVIGIVLSFVGVIFLLLIIYGGISWMFSAGNEQKVDKAKKIIINAVIGLIIVFASYFITDFIGSQFIN